jgi:hypothetical protein
VATTGTLAVRGLEEKANEPPRISWTLNLGTPRSSNGMVNLLTSRNVTASESVDELDPEHIAFNVFQHLDLHTIGRHARHQAVLTVLRPQDI